VKSSSLYEIERRRQREENFKIELGEDPSTRLEHNKNGYSIVSKATGLALKEDGWNKIFPTEKEARKTQRKYELFRFHHLQYFYHNHQKI
jgi:hypothetical protein